MRVFHLWIAAALFALASCGPRQEATTKEEAAPDTASEEVVRSLVARLDLERYKATIKGLTLFGDRLHGTDRNRAAVDWIETQLKSYGCATERFAYQYPPPEPERP